MTSHEGEDLTSVASIEAQEESQQSSAEPDEAWFIPNNQISYRAKERGLCSVCSQYDWQWHLMPHQDIIPPGGFYHSQADYEQRSLVTGEKFHTNNVKKVRKYVPTTRAPFPGHYGVTPTRAKPINTGIQLSPFSTMLRTRVYCALCDLTVRAIGSKLRCEELEQLQKSSTPMGLTCAGLSVLRFYPIGYTSTEILHLDFNLLSEVTQPRPQYGRISRSDQADLKVLKQFWTTCQQDHPQCVFKPPQFKAHLPRVGTDRQLRVVDVREAWVISAPPGCRYVALSYIWGAGKKTLIVTSDFVDPAPEFDSSLSSAAYAILDRDSLSPAFKDAMSFIESIGERYLWIDQLCILQDNIEHKTYSISIMDRIYKGAVFTIIAADSNVHSTGLSGFRPKSRNYNPVIGTIDSVTLIQAEPHNHFDAYDSPLGTSAWNKRGWTYQEFMLSSRIFVFVGGRVYYQCARGVIGEAEPGRNLPPFHFIPGGGKRYDREPFAQYSALVRGYTQRILTYPSDILNAFAGLMLDLGLKFGFEFCHGLPTKYIYFGLMWKTVTGNNSENKRRAGFPSWSWAGCFNAVEYDMNLQFETLNVHIDWRTPEVDWNKVQRTGELEFWTQVVVLNPQDCSKDGVIMNEYKGGMRSCLDNRKKWVEGPRECLMIAQKLSRHCDGGDTVDGDRIQALLIIKEISPGNHEREGFAEASTDFVNRFEPTLKHIRLV